MTWRFLLQKRSSLSPGEAANKRRIYIFLLCVAISTLFWLFNKLSQETTATLSKPIVFESLPDGLVAASQSDNFIKYRLKSTGLRLIRTFWFSPADTLFIQADVLPLLRREGRNLYFVDEARLNSMLTNRFGQFSSVETVQPDTVFVELVAATTKLLPVKPDADITFEQRFRLHGEMSIEPDSVLLTGPASILDTLKYVTTEHWVSGRLRQNTEQMLSLKKPLPLKSLHLETEIIKIFIPVAEFTESSIELPLHVMAPDGSSPPNVRLFPNRVAVNYLVALNDYASVNEQMFRAIVPCPISTDPGDGRLRVELEAHPSFIDVLSISPAFIEYIIIE